jgi:hypothetical protein
MNLSFVIAGISFCWSLTCLATGYYADPIAKFHFAGSVSPEQLATLIQMSADRDRMMALVTFVFGLAFLAMALGCLWHDRLNEPKEGDGK